jgi:hypothetical protein
MGFKWLKGVKCKLTVLQHGISENISFKNVFPTTQ